LCQNAPTDAPANHFLCFLKHFSRHDRHVSIATCTLTLMILHACKHRQQQLLLALHHSPQQAKRDRQGDSQAEKHTW
jgi:hypothetical protein